MASTRELPNKMAEQKIQSVLERLWLTYYNDTLFARGAITEDQRDSMRLRIKSRSATRLR